MKSMLLVSLGTVAALLTPASGLAAEPLPILPGEWELVMRADAEQPAVRTARKCLTADDIVDMTSGMPLTVDEWPRYRFQRIAMQGGKLTLLHSRGSIDYVLQPLTGSYRPRSFRADNAEFNRTSGARATVGLRFSGRRIAPSCAPAR